MCLYSNNYPQAVDKLELAIEWRLVYEKAMAVYTHCSHQEIEAFVQDYAIGELVAAKPIAEGVENSNYLLIIRSESIQHRYILTLYEKRVDAAELPFFLYLMEHLAASGRSCPLPIHAIDGAALRELNGRPAAIFSFLEGSGVRRIANYHLQELGAEVAKLHLAVGGFDAERKNALAPNNLGFLYNKVAEQLDSLVPGLQGGLGRDVEAFKRWPSLKLPAGVIHADLFPDNVFYIGEQLTGVIDFYFACTDYFAYDLAICLNAWCFEKDGDFNITKAKCLLQRYHALRPLSEEELEALPFMARAAAVRFLLTRAHDWFYPVEGAVVTPKDPMEYVRKWQFHSQVQHYGEYGL